MSSKGKDSAAGAGTGIGTAAGKQKAGGENSEISSCYEDTIYKNQSLCISYAHCECEWETEDGGYVVGAVVCRAPCW